MVHDVLLWIGLVLLHWKAGLVGGGTMGVITAALFIAERLIGKDFPKRYFIYLFVFGFLVASTFLTWEDQHNDSIMWSGRNSTLETHNARLETENARLTDEILHSKEIHPTGTSSSPPAISLLHGRDPLNGQAIAVGGPGSSFFSISDLHAKNNASASAENIHMRIYFSEKVSTVDSAVWIQTESDEPDYQSCFYSTIPSIDAGEPWNFEFNGGATANSNWTSMKVKLKFFYQAAAPTIANFTIKRRAAGNP